MRITHILILKCSPRWRLLIEVHILGKVVESLRRRSYSHCLAPNTNNLLGQYGAYSLNHVLGLGKHCAPDWSAREGRCFAYWGRSLR